MEDSRVGFYRHGTNLDYVHISQDGLHARHLDDTGEELHGVLISAEPLAVGRCGLYFEVELEEIRPEETFDGLTVGVTATPPDQVLSTPATAEHIPETWAVGYDGQMWDAASGGALSQIDWDPRTLNKGDVVGVLVTANQGELLVFRNHVACCPGPRAIPVGKKPLYAVVDLLGSARAVRWHTDAEPPLGR